MNENSVVAQSFSQAASYYHAQASVQRLVAKTLLNDRVGSSEVLEILDFGCGTGFLSEALLRLYPNSNITALDNAADMLDVARLNCQSSRITWLNQDVRDFQLKRRFDFALSSSALHWMLPYTQTFTSLMAHLNDGAQVSISFMLKGTLSELHSLREEIDGVPSAQEDLPAASSVLKIAEESGFTVVDYKDAVFTEDHKSAEVFMRSLKHLGLTTGVFSSGYRLLSRGELAQVIEQYNQRFANGKGGVTASYRVGFLELRTRSNTTPMRRNA